MPLLVFVDYDGKTIPVEVDADATIQDIRTGAGVDPSRRLMYQEMAFRHGCQDLLSDLGICMEAKLYVAQNVAGHFLANKGQRVQGTAAGYQMHVIRPTISRDDNIEICLTIPKGNKKVHDIGVFTAKGMVKQKDADTFTMGEWTRGNKTEEAHFATQNVRINGDAGRTKIRMRKEGDKLKWYKESETKPAAVTELDELEEDAWPLTAIAQSYGKDVTLAISWNWLD